MTDDITAPSAEKAEHDFDDMGWWCSAHKSTDCAQTPSGGAA